MESRIYAPVTLKNADGTNLVVNAANVCALTNRNDSSQPGCVIHTAGGTSFLARGSAEEVDEQIRKALAVSAQGPPVKPAQGGKATK